MHEVVLRLDADGNETATVELDHGATTNRISPRNAKRIQAFADKYQVDVIVVGSRVDPAKKVAPGQSDWDYLINASPGLAPGKNLREIERSAGNYLPKGRSRTDDFGNARAGLDTERNVALIPGKPYVMFRPRKR
jgi:hypothetical protein